MSKFVRIALCWTLVLCFASAWSLDEAALQIEENACYEKFAVAACLHDVKMRRIAMQAEFKRQESVRNDAQRRAKGEAQLKLIEEKKADANVPTAHGPEERLEREQAQAQKQRAHAQSIAEAQGRSVQVTVRNAPEVKIADPNGRASYAQKLEDARLKKLERDKRLAERSKTVAPLPVPK